MQAGKVLSKKNAPLSLSEESIHRFQGKVFTFYQHHRRALPWRQTTDSYKILVSEFMLQQTQVTRVLKYYGPWIQKWPTVQDLASATREQILQAWMGLGYNTRAVNLHKAAQKTTSEYHGDVLKAMEHYKEIPGVGRYISHAVLIFSTNADLVTVDTNIRRIFIAEFHLPKQTTDRDLWALAEQVLPKGRSREWHNALMDYGALHLTAQKTGIQPKTKQSRFEGSDRQIRAKILRQLLDQKATISHLNKMLSINRDRLRKILKKMTEEQLIVLEHNYYHIIK
jgi:A/G-specific adenine glycosylase